ncbi:hypothetical protein scyTo_0022339, partial [Scyliorhinus torazame]|nr:hypothetical protein [Scyliorhinus torazame]
LLLGKQIELKRYEVDGRKVLFYFDEIPSQCMTCVKFHAYREYIIGKTAPVPVKVYDYYEPGGYLQHGHRMVTVVWGLH